MTGRRAARAAAAALAVVALAACGDPGPEDGVAFTSTAVERYLEREVARTSPGLAVGAAACPDALPTADGAAATCQVEVAGVVLDYEVQRLAGGRFEARPARPVVVVAEVVEAVRQKLGDQAAEVRCGDAAVWQPQADGALRCTVVGGPKPRQALVTVGADGRVQVREA